MALRHSPTWPTLVIALASAFVTACGKPPAGGPPPAQGTPQVGFVVLAPQRVTLSTELPGRTAPVLIAEVRPQVTGLVQTRRFTEGAQVRAGELLYQIDPATYRTTVATQAAALAKAEASLVSVRLKADRYRELAAIDAVSKQDQDDAAASLQTGLADVASARAALDAARIDLERTRIVAPIGGRIGPSAVTPGALVTANQASALATVQQLDPIHVDVNRSSTTVLRLQRALAEGTLGRGTAKVKLLLEDGSVYAQDGKLEFSDVTVDAATGAVTLRAQFPNPKGLLLPGMYVRAVVEEGVLEQALLVPQPAISRDATGQPVAHVVNADGKLEARKIVTDRAIGDQWLVASGLAAGDKVVVEGQQKARPGAAVAAVPYAASASGAPPGNASNPPKTVAAAGPDVAATTAAKN